MICSVILPSRGRPEGLVAALHSITRTTDQPLQVETLVGLDDDDTESLSWIDRFESYSGVKTYVAPREPVSCMIYRLIALAKGTWIVLFNDDATMIGSGWDKELSNHPSTGVILQPEIHRLGMSTYYHDSGSAFPFFPRSFWNEQCCREGFNPEPADVGVPREAVRQGWKIEFIKGLTVFHDRKNP